MAARGFKPKADLTPEEKLTVAYMNVVVGYEQHHLATLYKVNPARVNKAIQTVRKAVGMKATTLRDQEDQGDLFDDVLERATGAAGADAGSVHLRPRRKKRARRLPNLPG